MEGLVGIALVATLVTAALVLAVLAKLGALSRELDELKKMVMGDCGEGRTLDERRKTKEERTLDVRPETIVERKSKMTRMTLSLAALALLGGCATSQMKSTPFYSGSERVYTGKPEDRVNLWPIGYYREPALSVLWPLFSLTDDHLAVRPIYSQFRQDGKESGYDEFNFIWPFCQFDTKHDEHRIFPLYWGDGHVDFFPLVWWRFDKSFTFFPLAWWKKDRYCNVFPLWYKDDKTFASLPYFSTTERLGGVTNTTTVIPPLLSWCERRSDGCGENRLLLGLGGWDSNADHGVTKSWMFPLWYDDEETFATLPYVKTKGTTIIPPLLSWFERTDSGRWKNRLLLGLAGWNSEPEKAVSKSWVFPFYYNDDDAFVSLPFAHVKDAFTYVTPFFGVTHEQDKKGAWLWPLYGWANDTDMEAAEAQLNADRLDSKIGVEKHKAVYSKGRTNRWYEVTGEARAHDKSWRLSGLSTSDRWISWSASDDGKIVMAKDKSDFGNFFAYKSENSRTVKFDAKSREKLSDEENGESGLLCNLLWHSKHEASKGHEYDMKSILWRFWHYEKLNGDVTVDSFPFFTYDSKTNGYSKTSLCWRLFRNEYDPKTDKRAIDFLFIPVWR